MTKGILLSGGEGTRLRPLTLSLSKQLLPVYDKPMIYYSISTLLLSGVTEILLVTDKKSSELYRDLLGDGHQWGVRIEYAIQAAPNGIVEAILIGEGFLGGSDKFALMLGDNIFSGSGLGNSLRDNFFTEGATVLATRVNNPEQYGVIEISSNGEIVGITEKPSHPQSNYAVPGLYFYDHRAVGISKTLMPSRRGELEITDLNNVYLELGQLAVRVLPRGTVWMDAGTTGSLADATEYVRAIEKRQGLKIGCPEEVSWRMGYIDGNQLAKLAEPLMKSGYGQYLLSLLGQGK